MNSLARPSRRALLGALVLACLPFAAARAQTSAPPAAKPADAPAVKPAAPAAAEKVYALLTTSKGDIVLELDRANAPLSVDNFMSYVDSGFYDGTTFHRVIPTFMIQRGGFTPDMKPKTTKPPIKNEWTNGLKNDRGTIALARQSAPDTATSQFFINVKDNPNLNGDAKNGRPGYAVFGKVIAGMDVVDAIKVVPTSQKGPHEAVPTEAVLINKATRLSEADAKKKATAAAAATPPAATPPAATPPATTPPTTTPPAGGGTKDKK